MPLVSLPKGANSVIAAPVDAAIRPELRWSAPSATDELDLFILLLDSTGRITDNADIVFYNQPDYAAGAAKYLGRSDAGPGQAHIAEITLERLPESVHSIALAAALDSEDSQLGSLSAQT